MQRNAPAVHGALLKTLENKKIQRSLEVVVLCLRHDGIPLDIYRRLPDFHCPVKLT